MAQIGPSAASTELTRDHPAGRHDPGPVSVKGASGEVARVLSAPDLYQVCTGRPAGPGTAPRLSSAQPAACSASSSAQMPLIARGRQGRRPLRWLPQTCTK